MTEEHINNPETDTALSLRERVSPKVSPALAIQTYEFLKSDSGAYRIAIDDFLAGKTDKIPLTYVNLFKDEKGNEIDFGEERASLETLIRDLRDPEYGELDDPAAEMTLYSALYRYSELEFLETIQQLNRPDATKEELLQTAEKYRRLNETLYGVPTPETFNKIQGEIWGAIHGKRLSPDAKVLATELQNGFVSETGVPVGPLEYSDAKLPRLSPEAERWVKEQLFNDYGEYFSLAKRHWDEIVVPRANQTGQKPEFTGEDLYRLFVEALTMMDPAGESGIQIERKDNSGILSWNTPTLSVRVGVAERKTPVDSPEKAFGKLLHELVAFHGGRTKKGLQTDAPILGMGVYSKFDEGENPDYLTFEEGIASLVEAILSGEIHHDPGTSQWEPERLRLYANTAMASLGQRNTREVYEVTWRYTVLMRVADSESPSEEQIKKAKREAAQSLERYDRSIPANLPEEVGRIGFHKDISYLNGRVIAIKVIEDLARRNDVESFRNLQAVKIDPTNHRQREFAAEHAYPITLEIK